MVGRSLLLSSDAEDSETRCGAMWAAKQWGWVWETASTFIQGKEILKRWTSQHMTLQIPCSSLAMDRMMAMKSKTRFSMRCTPILCRTNWCAQTPEMCLQIRRNYGDPSQYSIKKKFWLPCYRSYRKPSKQLSTLPHRVSQPKACKNTQDIINSLGLVESVCYKHPSNPIQSAPEFFFCNPEMLHSIDYLILQKSSVLKTFYPLTRHIPPFFMFSGS